MPKKKSARPNASLGSSQKPEPKSASQIRREKTIRIGAISIILALLASLIAGAISITPSTPAKAESVQNLKSVANSSILAGSVESAPLDTDGDGIENNQDPDIDGDGIVNGIDPDIDGDGKPNFSDGDPAETNGIDTNAPNHPEGVTVQNLVQDNPAAATLLAVLAGLTLAALVWFLRVSKRRK